MNECQSTRKREDRATHQEIWGEKKEREDQMGEIGEDGPKTKKTSQGQGCIQL